MNHLRDDGRDIAALAMLAAIGGATSDQVGAAVFPERTRRTAQAALARLEALGMVTQHHRSARVPADGGGWRTVRLASVFALTRRGAGVLRERDPDAPRPAPLGDRPLREVAQVGALAVALLAHVPRVAGLYVAPQPAISPAARSARAAALIVLHQWREEPDGEGRPRWLAGVDTDARLHRAALLVERDLGWSKAALKRRAAAHGAPEAWRDSALGLVPRVLWIIDGPRRAGDLRGGFGAGYPRPWHLVAEGDLGGGSWAGCQGTRSAPALRLAALNELW